MDGAASKRSNGFVSSRAWHWGGRGEFHRWADQIDEGRIDPVMVRVFNRAMRASVTEYLFPQVPFHIRSIHLVDQSTLQ